MSTPSKPVLDLRDIVRDRESGTIKTMVAADAVARKVALLQRELVNPDSDREFMALMRWSYVYASVVCTHKDPEHEKEFDHLCAELEKWGNKKDSNGSARCTVLVR